VLGEKAFVRYGPAYTIERSSWIVGLRGTSSAHVFVAEREEQVRNDGITTRVKVSYSHCPSKVLVSFGVSKNWSFEEAVIDANPTITVHSYDHTVSEALFLRMFRATLLRCLLRKASAADVRSRLATYRSYKRFFKTTSAVRHFKERIFSRVEGPQDVTIDNVFARLDGKGDVVLKMDIEGTEYRVIDDVLRYAGRISLMIIEFHQTEPLRGVFLQKIARIREYFNVVHLHGNNWAGIAADGVPECLEITFMSRRYSAHLYERGYRKQLPLSGLDCPNNPQRPDYDLLFT
jgi:hypothetical protein